MTENPPIIEDLEKENEKSAEKPEIPDEKGAWSEDQRQRSYYYDDACGYETYDPDENEPDED